MTGGASVVAIEGLPGAGKTTCARLVSAQLGWPEVLEQYGDHPFLGTIYREQFRHDLLVETQFLLLHFAQYRELGGGSVIADFAPAKDLVFADLVLAGDDAAVFQRLYDHFYATLPPPALTVFVDTPPDECLHRVQARAREFERDMQLDWLLELRDSYRRRLEELGSQVSWLPVKPDATAREVAAQVVNEIGDDLRAGTTPGWEGEPPRAEAGGRDAT
jgi:deoxyguanosine kinase